MRFEKHLNEKIDFDKEYKEEFSSKLNGALFMWGKIPQYDEIPVILNVFGKRFGKEYPELNSLAKIHKQFSSIHEKINQLMNQLYKKV